MIKAGNIPPTQEGVVMENKEHLQRTLEHYRQLRQQKLEEIRPIEMMIRQLELDLGESPTIDNAASREATAPSASGIAVGPGIGTIIRPDEFFGMSQNDAAKAFLRKMGRAIPFADLVTALQKGGAKLGGADPSKTLYVSLARNPKKEFVWPSSDHISLAEFYGRRESGT
jgi:hypothetical protein